MSALLASARASALFVVLPYAALSCAPAEPGGEPDAGPTVASVAWYPTVASLVNQRCVTCHQEGGVGPFSLETYEDARELSGVIAEVTADRVMPPWGIDNSGACQTFHKARWLSDDDIATLSAWHQAGAPEGDPADTPTPAAAPQALARVDATLEMEAGYAPDTTYDDYRCFLVDPGVDTDRFLTGFEVRPGEPSVVHHVIVYSLDDAQGEAAVEQLDAQQEGPGYTCFGGPGTSRSSFLIGWAPGTYATELPAGTGVRLPAGRKAVMQIHYHPTSEAVSDRTRVDLLLEDTVEREAYLELYADYSMSLTPGVASLDHSYGFNVPANVTLLGIFPHMHTLGRQMAIDLVHNDRGGESECVADVPRWDFEGQQLYLYENPISVHAGDRMNVTCTYDTTSRATVTTFGESTTDEMCVAIFYFTVP